VAALAASLTIAGPALYASLDNRVYDRFVRALPAGEASRVPVIIDIDERSLDRYGQWPWPRYRMARLLEGVRRLGASSVALDMVFAEPDRTSLSRVREEMKRDLGLELSLEGVPRDLMDNDRMLAAELERGHYVLSYEFTFTEGNGDSGGCSLHPLDAAFVGRAGEGRNILLHSAAGVICNDETFSLAAGVSGFFNATADRDGVLRRVPVVIEYGGKIYPSLALAALMEARGEERVVLESTPTDNSLILAGKRIPLDGRGSLLLRYRGGAGVFRYLSAADVLDGFYGPGELAGKIAFIGTSAAGLHEIRTTPLAVNHPGVEVHATVVDNILSREFISRPTAARAAEVLFVLLAGAAATIALVPLKAGRGLLFTGLAAVILWMAAKGVFLSGGFYISPVAPLLTLAVLFALLESLKLWEEEKKVRERTLEFTRAQDAIIQSMASLAETRDKETGGHIQRTQHYVRALAEQLRKNRRYRGLIDDEEIDMLFKVAPLHDVGKVGVSDSILLKPDRLTEEEYEEMKKHTTYASDTILAAEEHLGGNRFLHMAREIAESHQEWWDGTGYPRGLKGEEIPFSGRLMAVADVYDALISRRRYKDAYGHEEAVEIIRGERGSHFDPDVVDAFLDLREEFREIARRFSDGTGTSPLFPPP